MFYNSYGQQQEEYIRNAFMGGLLFQNQFYGNTYGSSYYCPCGNALGNQYAGGCSPEVVYSMIQQALNPVISVLVAHLKECQSLQSKCSHCKVHIEQPSQYVEPEVEQEPEPEPELEPEPEPCEVEEYYEEGPGPTLVLASSFAETKPFTPKLEIHHPKADMIKVIDFEAEEEDTEEEKLQIHSDPTDSEVISQVNKESPKTPPARRGRFKFASLWEAGTEDSFWFNRININHFN
eukprot:TRINITY_DN633_c0_g2_i2.p1 TRINITY_DN633_c0_g2~~TRINITY_DN633_c0_g2_i2.p1  ORF type:complete len:235 (-),score=31.08 TRINITY_DN633_c0_g2_i2:19-723(-)